MIGTQTACTVCNVADALHHRLGLFSLGNIPLIFDKLCFAEFKCQSFHITESEAVFFART